MSASVDQQQQPNPATNHDQKRVLFILTNVDKMRDGTEKPTGTTIGSLASAFDVFRKKNFLIDFLSPSGGYCPIDQHSLLHHGSDQVCRQFMSEQSVLASMSSSMKPSDLTDKVHQYDILFVPGGIGQLWDVAQSEEVAKLIAQFYEKNPSGFIGTIGHGLSALLNVKLSSMDNKYLLHEKTVTAFTKEEEEDSQTASNVPFCLEDECMKRGAQFEHGGLWQSCFKVSDRLCTSQNQKSSAKVAEMLCQLCN